MSATETTATREATCDRHGAFMSRDLYAGRVWSQCPACNDEHKATEVAEAQLRELAATQEAYGRRVAESGIPERFCDRTLACYAAKSAGEKRALAFALAYATDFDAVLKTGRSAIFVGQVGTGKTHLACGIALQVLTKRTALYTTVMQAVRRIRGTWAKGTAETESEALAAFVHPALLIIDEVGIQYGTEAERVHLFEILDGRYSNRLPTLLLSNLTIDQVSEAIGARALDRLKEDGGKIIAFDWPSHRGKTDQ